jgi:hypothetical protein
MRWMIPAAGRRPRLICERAVLSSARRNDGALHVCRRNHWMSAAITNPSGAHQPSPARIGEWFWRFLAVVMLIVVGWVVWIAIQISPPEIILPAAYEAAAQGRATRNVAGTIGAAGVALAPAAPQAPVQIEPPVNLEKLRMADSIETPIFERTRRPARPVSDTGQ